MPRHAAIWPAILAVLALAATMPSARAASFDCAKAATVDERAVCADPQLSELDSALGAAFDQARRASAGDEDAPKVTSAARAFLAGRKGCGAAKACLLSAYAGGILGYRRFGATVGLPGWISAVALAGGGVPKETALPTRAGQCAASRVKAVGARLEGEPPGSFESGTGVELANGATGVSYEREEPVIASRPGDPVVVCLTHIPRDCPPGDARGRWYTVTNLRTRATWSLPDAQHMCGGA